MGGRTGGRLGRKIVRQRRHKFVEWETCWDISKTLVIKGCRYVCSITCTFSSLEINFHPSYVGWQSLNWW